MGNKTRIAAAAVSAVMALSVVPQAAFADMYDPENVEGVTKIASRLGGLDRAQTAAKIADAHKQLGAVDTVIITVGRNFPDALAATPLADQLDAPVLLNDGARLNDPTAKWLFDNVQTVKHVYIVGGSGVIPQTVIDDIKGVYQQARGKFKELQDPSFVRYSGVDRNETAYVTSARTVAGYFENDGVCKTDGAEIVYTAAQRATVPPLRAADATLENSQKVLAEYNAAKAAYEAAKAALDQARDNELAAKDALDKALEDLAAVTAKLQDVPALAPLYEAVRDQSNLIGKKSVELAELQGLLATLDAIHVAGVQAGIVETEEDVWENALLVDWDHVLAQLPELAAQIAAVRTAAPGANMFESREALEGRLDTAQTEFDGLQKAYAQAQAALDEALAKDAANRALRDELSAASAKVIAAQDAYTAALDATTEAVHAFVAARKAYAAVVQSQVINYAPRVDLNDPLTWDLGRVALEGNIRRAQVEVAKALDAVVAAAHNVPVFVATGRDFADALTAGPAAADQCGVILLTDDVRMSPATNKWISTAKPKVVVAVGGQARNAAGESTTVAHVGKDRFETAKLVNLAYLSDRDVLGIATGYDYPDALTGAALVANTDGGMLLTNVNEVPYQTSLGIQGGDWSTPIIFGGTGVVSAAVSTEINGILN